MNQFRINVSLGIVKLLQKRNVEHFQIRRDFRFDDNSRRDYMDHFQQVQLMESPELESRDR